MFAVWTGWTGTVAGSGSESVTRVASEVSKSVEVAVERRWTGVVTRRGDRIECSSSKCIAESSLSPTVPSLSLLGGSNGIKPYGRYFCPY